MTDEALQEFTEIDGWLFLAVDRDRDTAIQRSKEVLSRHDGDWDLMDLRSIRIVHGRTTSSTYYRVLLKVGAIPKYRRTRDPVGSLDDMLERQGATPVPVPELHS